MFRRRRVIAIIALGLTPFLTGCNRIFAGDSITWDATNEIKALFGAEAPPTYVDAVPGRGLYDVTQYDKGLWNTVSELKKVTSENGTVFIQDDAYGGSYDTAAEFVQRVNSHYADRPDVCLVWTLPFRAIDPVGSANAAQALRDHVGGHRSAILDAPAIFDARPELVPDGVHPNEAGQNLLVLAMQEAETHCS